MFYLNYKECEVIELLYAYITFKSFYLNYKECEVLYKIG